MLAAESLERLLPIPGPYRPYGQQAHHKARRVIVNPVHVTRELIRDLAPIGSQLSEAASRLAYIKDLLPKRGELTEEFRELVTVLAHIENAYNEADARLLEAYVLLEHAQRVPHPLPLASQLPDATLGDRKTPG